jgi:predicted Zn finger-like uncharacterized protein
MNIICHACHAKYAVPDEKVRGRKVRFRCRACGNMVLVTDVLSSAGNTEGFVREDSVDRTLDSTLDRTTPVHTRSYAAPLFDRSEPEPEPEPSCDATTRKAAVVVRDVERDRDRVRAKRDLFAYDPSAVIEQALSGGAAEPPPPPPSRSVLANGTGERSETSVLFTLAALSGVRAAGGSRSAALERRPLEATGDGGSSGLIDLKAMMADVRELPPQQPPVKSAFASDPPLGAFTTSVSTSPSLTRGRRGRWLGAGIAAAAVALVGIGFATFGGGDDTPIAAAIPAVVVEPPAPAVPPPEQLVQNEAKSPLPATDDSVATKSKGRGKGVHRGAGKAATAAHRTTAASAASAPAKPATASDPCHCKGNLMCAMKCAT